MPSHAASKALLSCREKGRGRKRVEAAVAGSRGTGERGSSMGRVELKKNRASSRGSSEKRSVSLVRVVGEQLSLKALFSVDIVVCYVV